MYKIEISPYSKTFYIEWKIDPNSYKFNINFDQYLYGDLDVCKLDKSVKKFASEYLLFNSHIQNINDHIYWVANDEIFGIDYYSNALSDYGIQEYITRPFNLEKGPLYRFLIAKIDEKKYRFLCVIHHMIIDGLSANSFIEEISNFYNKENHFNSITFENQILKINEFNNYFNNHIKENISSFKEYWNKKILDVDFIDFKFLKCENKNKIKNLNDNINYQSNIQKLLNISEIKFSLKSNINIKRKFKVTPYIYSMAIYAITLHKFTRKNKFCITYPIGIKEGSELIFGANVNLSLIKFDFSILNNISDVINEIKCQILESKSSIKHSYAPIYEIISNKNKDILKICFGNTNFKNKLFNFNNINCDIIRTNIELEHEFSFDIEINDNIHFRILFSELSINKFLINQFANTYIELFSKINDDISNNLDNLDLIAYKTVTHDALSKQINLDHIKEYKNENLIHNYFEYYAKLFHNKLAIIYGINSISYAVLNEKSNQIANYLKSNYLISGDDLIAVLLERDEFFPLYVLGILKAGGAYVPLDPEAPFERNNFIVNDSKPKVIITNSKFKKNFEDTNFNCKNFELVLIDTEKTQLEFSEYSKIIPKLNINSNNLAYVIYTSGTTGHPKGVMIEHKNVVNLRNNLSDMEINGDILAYSNYIFDASIFELCVSIFSGNSLHILSNEIRKNTILIEKYILEFKISNALLPPILLENLNITNINMLFTGGDKTSRRVVQSFLDKGINFYNAYGPTEITVLSTIHKFNSADESNLIGKPICNTSAYVLDEQMNLVPIGAVGELHIGGVGLARGYLNRPELTKEKFVENPFQSDEEKRTGKNSRLYKSGDLVRWLPDGNLEYIGRNDFQVKIRGYRIELSEIENIILGKSEIKQTLVVAKEQKGIEGILTGNKYLVCYYVSESKLNENDILAFLKQKLPDYMIPNFFIYLTNFPVNSSGKIDRKLLPEVNFTKSNNYALPRNAIEEKLCEIWSEILGIPSNALGIKDDFFRLGGDSIISIQISSKVRQKLKIDISVKDIFECRTIEVLYNQVISKYLQEKKEIKRIQQEELLPMGEVPLLAIQKWFFDSNFCNKNHWNQSFLIATTELDSKKLELSINKLIQRHKTFQLRYKNENGKWIQYYTDKIEYPELRTLDLKSIGYVEGSKEFEEELQNVFTNWQNDFEITNGKLYSFGYVYGYKDKSARIYVAIHHLIVDTVSWRILTEELNDIYLEKELELRGSSYRQWVNSVRDYSEKHHNEKSYWENILNKYKFYHEQNKLYELSIQYSGNRNSSSIELTELQTNNLLSMCHEVYNTNINDLLLSSLLLTLKETTDIDNHYILLEGHGREEINDTIDISNTIGWFTTLYPVNLELKSDLKNTIINTKEILREIPNKGIGFGQFYNYDSKNIPKISFNYLGQLDNKNSMECTNENKWSISWDSAGVSVDKQNKDDLVININGLVINGALKVYFSCKLPIEITNKIATVFKVSLEKIIAHTINKNRCYLTSSDVENIISQKELDNLQEEKEIEAVYLANSLQQGFIYHALNQGQVDDAYFVQTVWEYKQRINIESLKQAWIFAIEKYPSLRLRFSWENSLLQIIDKFGMLDWRYIDLSHESDDLLINEKINEIQLNDRNEKFKLEKSCLFRIYLVKQSDELYTCIFSSHHSISDGWSNPILMNFIHENYFKIENREKISFETDSIYFLSQKYLQINKDKDTNYWKSKVSEIQEFSDFRNLLNQSSKSREINLYSYKNILNPREINLSISDINYKNIQNISKKNGITINSIIQYAWHKTLSIYGNTKQTIVGITNSGRNIPIEGIENSFGLYINTLPLIVDHFDNIRIIEKIKIIQDNINEINSKWNINLANIQINGRRLFDSIFIFENYPMNLCSSIKMKYKESFETFDYPLGIVVNQLNDSLNISLKYAGEIFNEHIINKMFSTMYNIIFNIECNKYESEIKYIDSIEYIKCNSINDKFLQLKDKNIVSVFEEYAKKYPKRNAVIFNGNKFTYENINEISNKIARYLINNLHVNQEDLICLFLSRNQLIIIAILAVLKSGAAYVPIDPSYPVERIKNILEDTKSKIILTNDKYLEIISEINSSIGIVSIDNDDFNNSLSSYSSENLQISINEKKLAYVIYTSGTSGKPKGIMIEHRGVINLINVLKYDLNLINNLSVKKCVLNSNYVFDVHVCELCVSIFNGNSLYITSEETRKDLNKIKNFIIENEIDVLFITPNILNNSEIIPVKTLFLAGDKVPKNIVRNYINSGINIVNSYGPSEITAFSNRYYLSNECENNVIGQCIENTKFYVLDSYLNPLPIGSIGELYLSGAGIARGYVNNIDLTNKSFILNPFQNLEEKKLNINSKIYKTGDLVTINENNELEFIGRNDFQVKIRGHRVELSEIENTTLNYSMIKQCVVISKKYNNNSLTNDKYLLGYFTSDIKIESEEILNYLKERLPEYMIPRSFLQLDKIPLNHNGKLDIHSLPEHNLLKSNSFYPPRDEMESKICQIISEIIGISKETVGIRDDFYQLGGNSILVINFVNRINNEFSISVNISDILKNKNAENIKTLILSEQCTKNQFGSEYEL
ncbi:non-ribosomal peptide synthetase [Silvanigrella aquatica]|uniref:Carrier domain-containing protein n=1 Tax=Silvanigrella aquatica TaxID=1915309 RepID=A0A1L4CXS9_9BACT|nr:non-ribosomal peptide synthetase [Silvanigrella aquatica]APJ02762.1 hypothetical protein AXG55_02010 [Silvanigrella aquatica]